ncbi:MAG: hypothetical protein RL291_1737 [Pseudomonadota bacterium]
MPVIPELRRQRRLKRHEKPPSLFEIHTQILRGQYVTELVAEESRRISRVRFTLFGMQRDLYRPSDEEIEAARSAPLKPIT